jgi:DNA-binding NarL/FixJ family response regulator
MVGERKVGSGMPPVSLSIPRPGLAPVRAELRAARAKNGEYFLGAELEDPSPTQRLMDLASRHHLTKTESRVLQLLSLGLSDKEIAARLFVSVATVHSHVNHVLRKMGLNSRVHAILRVHGVKGV